MIITTSKYSIKFGRSKRFVFTYASSIFGFYLVGCGFYLNITDELLLKEYLEEEDITDQLPFEPLEH